MTDPAVAIRGLSKAYPAVQGYRALLRSPFRNARLPALTDVTLDIGVGEVVGLLGPNAAGKTTLVEILATLLLPDAGSAVVGGHDVVREAGAVRSLIGYAPSDTDTLHGRLTGAENLEFFGVLRHVPPRRLPARIHDLFDLVGLERAQDDRFQRYSDGMKARLSLARALLADPPVLLLGEPTKSLDPVMQREIRTFFRETLVRRMRKTVLLVTHSVEEAVAVCDRVVIMHRGRLRYQGRPDTLGGGDLAGLMARIVDEDG